MKKLFQKQNFEGLEYFSIHSAADTKHSAEERALLESYVTADNQALVRSSVDRILDALGGFLSSLCQKYAIACPSH